MVSKFSVTVTSLGGTVRIIEDLTADSSLHDLTFTCAAAFDAPVYSSMLALGTEALVLNAGWKSLSEVGIRGGSELSFTETSAIKWLPASLHIGCLPVPPKIASRMAVRNAHRENAETFVVASMEGTYLHAPIPTNPHIFMRDDGKMLYWCFKKEDGSDGTEYFWKDHPNGKMNQRFADPTFSGFGTGVLSWVPTKGKEGRYTSGIVKLVWSSGVPSGLEFKFAGLSTELYGNDDFMLALVAAQKRGEQVEPEIVFQDSDEEDGMVELTDDQFATYKACDAVSRRAMREELGF